jgi:membrane dipeptidase
MLEDIEESSSEWALATTVDDIRNNAANHKISVVLCFQGSTPLEDKPNLLRVYYRLGLRIINLVSSYSNAAVGSRKEDSTCGLTRLGRAIIEEAQSLGMIIDAGSMSEQGFWDTVELVDGPVIVSLGNAFGVHDYRGNLRDKQLEALAKKDGLVGLIANGKLVCSKPRLAVADFVDHIDYIVDLIGVDYVSIGPDIVEDGMYPLEAYRRVFAEEGYWSAVYPEGLSSHRELHNLTVELLNRGYSESDVSKILGGNFLRVCRHVWGN